MKETQRSSLIALLASTAKWLKSVRRGAYKCKSINKDTQQCVRHASATTVDAPCGHLWQSRVLTHICMKHSTILFWIFNSMFYSMPCV